MSQTASDIISAILQVIVFTLIPFVFYLFRKDKKQSFAAYIGFSKPTGKSIAYAVGFSMFFVVMGVCLVFINDGFKQAVLSPVSVTGKIRAMGLNAGSIFSLLIMAWIKTSLSEEIFFRGFLAKRLINKLGFKTGNIIQALIFGLVHLLLVWALMKMAFAPMIVIFIFSSFAGWGVGYIKEKYGNGSILPGWVAHGLGNTISYFIISFMI